ncbi:MAG: hypothetical protein V1646_01095 [bacterium]
MKKKIICCTIVVSTLVLTPNLSPKHMMPSLERLKNKVEGALQGPKVSLKEFLEKTKNVGSKIFINGRSVESLNTEAELKSFENEIKEIDAILANLYWCKQEIFAKELTAPENVLAQNILSLLKEKFKEKYPNVKSPLMTFAKDLAQENETLDVVKGKLQKSMLPVKKFKEFEKKYLELAQDIVKYSETLNDIIKATDSL